MPEFAPVLVVTSLNGTNGFRLDGDAPSVYAGRAVAGGDINGDGFSDLLVGAPLTGTGVSYVVFGAPANPASETLGALVAAGTAYALQGETANEQAGLDIANAGDVDGDGFNDFIIGARYADPDGGSNRGASYLVFGGAAKLEAFDNAGSVNDNVILLGNVAPANGYRFDGVADGNQAGYSVSGAGDVNGDGMADLLIGAWFAGPNTGNAGEGATYVVFGGSINLADLDDNDGSVDGRIDLALIGIGDGLRLDGPTIFPAANSGTSVALVGDVNGDGFDDVLTGAPFADPNNLDQSEGAAYLVFGRPQALFTSAELELANPNGIEFTRFDGDRPLDAAATSVNGLGDINADGFADIVVGAPNAGPASGDTGSAYVVFGRSLFGNSSDLAALNGVDGFRLDGARIADSTGFSVSAAGDVNGDGFADILVSAHKFNRIGGSPGAAYVVFGKASGFTPVVDLAALDGNDGFRIEGAGGNDFFGLGVCGPAGDVNRDGFDDIVVGALLDDSSGFNNSGAAYVIYGHRAETDVVRTGTGIANRINGGVGDDVVNGLGGDDTLFGWEQDDTIDGGGGNDVIDGGVGSDTVSGGGGDDQVKMSFGFDEIDGGSGKDTLDFRNLSGSAILDMGLGIYTLSQSQDDGTFSEVEQVIMTNGADTITGSTRNDIIQAAKGNDTVNGAAGNDFIAGNYGRDTLTGGLGNDTFDYNALSESSTNASIRDIITDFKVSGADRIDLGTLDANATLGGNQAFTFLAPLGAAFTAAGQVRYTQSGGNTFVDVNTDANFATIEMQIQLTGLKTLVAADFVL